MDRGAARPLASPARAATGADVDCVVTHHLNPFASGVVRFNELLAQHLGVPFVGLFDGRLEAMARPLLSFKVSELSDSQQADLNHMLATRHWEPQVYLHDWHDLALERRLLELSTCVWCGNLEIAQRVAPLHPRVETVWTPGLLSDQRVYAPAEISVFSFGMAHKIQADRFRRLRELLEGSGRTYTVYLSTANHETKSIRDAQFVYEEMQGIFPSGLYFVGNLSDVAVFNHLRSATFFASFFPKGARANNTSISAAMEQGSVVITNLDKLSPPHLRHMENVIDIGRCDELPQDPLTLKRLSLAAMESARERSWGALVEMMRNRS